MGYTTNSSGDITIGTGNMEAGDFNAVVNMYSAIGVSLYSVVPGNPILASDWTNLYQAVYSYTDNSPVYSASLPDPSIFSSGKLIVPMTWGYPVLKPQTLTITETTSFTIPHGVTQVLIHWLQAPGGGGGWGAEGGEGTWHGDTWKNHSLYGKNYKGGGGDGGGSGGYWTNQLINVSPEDNVTVTIGSPGRGAAWNVNGTLYYGPAEAPVGGQIKANSDPTAGGDVSISVNDNVVLTATGGQPGNANGGTVVYNNGAGGSPGGTQGGGGGHANGIDSWSGWGGLGANGAYPGSTGGIQGKNGGSCTQCCGQPGTGYGSGGGGSGVNDRTNPGLWTGGDGAPGICVLTYPPA